jgi:hypothetical protein
MLTFKRIGWLASVGLVHAMLLTSSNVAAARQRPTLPEVKCELAPDRDDFKLKLKKQEAVEVRDVTRRFIDTLFGERKARAAVERYFHPLPWSKVENKMLDSSGLDSAEDYPVQDARTFARGFALEWKFEDQWVWLALGTSPLWRDGVSFDTAGAAQDDVLLERERLLKEHQLTSSDYHILSDERGGSADDLERKLAALESIDAEIDHFIDAKIDQETYKRNVAFMRARIKVTKYGLKEHVFYEACFEPGFRALFSRRADGLKLIGLADSFL